MAYISLHSPIRGNSSLHPVASPSLQQLVLEVRWTKCQGIITQGCILLSRLVFLGLFHLSNHKMICKGFEELPAIASVCLSICLPGCFGGVSPCSPERPRIHVVDQVNL